MAFILTHGHGRNRNQIGAERWLVGGGESGSHGALAVICIVCQQCQLPADIPAICVCVRGGPLPGDWWLGGLDGDASLLNITSK